MFFLGGGGIFQIFFDFFTRFFGQLFIFLIFDVYFFLFSFTYVIFLDSLKIIWILKGYYFKLIWLLLNTKMA